MRKINFPICALLILISPISLALQCPNVKIVKNKGLSHAMIIDDMYKAVRLDNYKTNKRWSFYLSIPIYEAFSEEDALKKASTALPDLYGEPIPIRDGYDWRCVYFFNHYTYSAEAFTYYLP